MLVLRNDTTLSQMMAQFVDFEGSEEGMVRLLRFHQALSQLEGHEQWLENALEASLTLQDTLIAGEYVAFLRAFLGDDRIEGLNNLRLRMLDQLVQRIEESEQVRRCMAMLWQEEELEESMAGMREKMRELTRISRHQRIVSFLDLLVKNMQWRAKSHKITRPSHPNMTFIFNVIDLLASEDYEQREEILQGMVRLAGATMKYLNQCHYFAKGSNPINRNKLVRMRESWMPLTIYKQQVALDICTALTVSLELFGLETAREESEKHASYYQFLNKNEHCMNQLQYLQFLLTFLNHLQTEKDLNRRELTSIINKLLKTIIHGSKTSVSTNYSSKAMISDIIIKISSLFTCQSSREISTLIKQNHTQHHLAFIGALYAIFDQKISKEILRTVPQDRRHFIFISRETRLYDETLARYCDDKFQINEQFTNNPEISELYMWDLLLLRITIAINYNALRELNKMHILINNLLKMLIVGCLPDQCFEILEKIIQRPNDESLKELQHLSLGRLIEDMKPILIGQVEGRTNNDTDKFTALYRNLKKVMQLVTKEHDIKERKQPLLFIVVLRSSSILNEYFLPLSLLQAQATLLSLTVPLDFKRIQKEMLQLALAELIAQIERHRSLHLFLLYLQMMARGRLCPRLYSIFTEQNGALSNAIREVVIPPTILQSWRILSYIVSRSEITAQVVKQGWDLISNVDTYHYLELFYNVVHLQKSADEQILERNAEQFSDYLTYQMQQIETLLSLIDKKVEESAFLIRIGELTRYKLALLYYLTTVASRYVVSRGPPCDHTAKLDLYMRNSLKNMKETHQMAAIFTLRPEIRIKWIDCQLGILLIISALRRNNLCLSDQHVREVASQLDEKSEMMKKIYPTGFDNVLKDFARTLNISIFKMLQTVPPEQRRSVPPEQRRRRFE